MFEVLCTLRVGAWFFIHLVVPTFYTSSKNISFALHTNLGLPHPLVFGLIHYICGELLDPSQTHLLSFLLPWWGMDCIPQCHLGCLYIYHERHGVSCSVWANSYPSTAFPLVLLPMGWHGVINWWDLHNGRCISLLISFE
jgi:hypothetical protein